MESVTTHGSAHSDEVDPVTGLGVGRILLSWREEEEDVGELVWGVGVAEAAFTSAKHSAKISDRK